MEICALMMNQNKMICLIEEKKPEIIQILEKYKASNLRIFGSYARGEETPESDLDLLVDMEAGTSLFDRIALMQELEDLLGVQVDIAKPENLHHLIREKVMDEAITL